MIWEDYKSEFNPDGHLRDLYIKDVNHAHWQSLLQFLRSTHADLKFYVDGKVSHLPTDIQPVLQDKSHNYLLAVHLGGVNIQCDFASSKQITLEFDPLEIDDEFKANLIFRLMSTIGRTLDKSVVCAQANGVEKAIFQYRPGETIEYLAK